MIPNHRKIYEQMPKIMLAVGPIAKERQNKSQGYAFRGVDDVYCALQLIMAQHGVFSLPKVLSERTEERTTKSGSNLIYRILTIRYRFYAEDGSFVDSIVIGEGMDSGDKSSNKAMSVADKYSLLQAFKIPTEEAKDPENDHHEVEPITDPVQQYYDNHHNPDKQWLCSELHKRGVDKVMWPYVAIALHGEPKVKLEDGIKKGKANHHGHMASESERAFEQGNM